MDERPRIAIGSWPTPTRRLERVSEALGAEIWAKLEEECGTWGGNKVRKLEYILGAARAEGLVRLVGFGAGTSNWTSALAFHGARQGFDVEVVVSAKEVPNALAALYDSVGARVRSVGPARFVAEAAVARIRPRRGATRSLPPGGTGAEGTLGSAETGKEIARAIKTGELPRPSKTFVATGTGGTAAGISMGAATDGEPLHLVCVRVAPRPFGTRRGVTSAIRSTGLRPAGRLETDHRFFAPGYGRPNEASLEAAAIARLDGLDLDPTYGAKAFASVVAHSRTGERGPFLFIHTSPGPIPAGI